MSPGNASSRVSRSCPNTEWAYLVANGLPVGSWVTTMPRSNRPEHTRTNATRSRCDGSMLACTLNTNAENGSSILRAAPSTSSRGDGGGASSTMPSSSMPTPKLVMADPTNTGDCSPARNRSMSTVPASSSSSDTSSTAAFQASPSSAAARSASTTSDVASAVPWAVRPKRT